MSILKILWKLGWKQKFDEKYCVYGKKCVMTGCRVCTTNSMQERYTWLIDTHDWYTTDVFTRKNHVNGAPGCSDSDYYRLSILGQPEKNRNSNSSELKAERLLLLLICSYFIVRLPSLQLWLLNICLGSNLYLENRAESLSARYKLSTLMKILKTSLFENVLSRPGNVLEIDLISEMLFVLCARPQKSNKMRPWGVISAWTMEAEQRNEDSYRF